MRWNTELMGPKQWQKNKDGQRKSFPPKRNQNMKYRSSSSGCCEVINSSDTVIRLQVELTSSLLTPAVGEHHFYVFQVWWTRPQPFRDPTVPSVHLLPAPTWALSPPTGASAPPWSQCAPADTSAVICSALSSYWRRRIWCHAESWRIDVLTFNPSHMELNVWHH